MVANLPKEDAVIRASLREYAAVQQERYQPQGDCIPVMLAAAPNCMLPNVHVDRPRRANASQRSGRT